jgi:acetyl/propionyl-CoA carboxylase alpha subunit
VKYFVSLGGREFEVEVDGDRILVDGAERGASLSAAPGTPLRLLLLGERSVTLGLEPAGRGRWVVGWCGEQWEAEVIDERTRHIRALTGAGEQVRGPAVLKAPMPGMVLRLQVEVGQAVGVGAGLVVLEAMKMENELRSAAPGIVRAVRVRPGEAVEKGQVLLEFEAGT